MKLIFTLATAMMMSACATTTKPSEAEKAIASGSVEIEGGWPTIIGEDGATLVGTDGMWRSYIGPNGRIATQILSDESIKELSWRINESGVWCEIGYVSGKEECSNDGMRIVKSTDGTYTHFLNSEPEVMYTLERGNPYNL